MKQQLTDFLKKYHMHYSEIDLDKCTEDFAAQMQSGNDGNVKSLLMIPTYVGIDGEVPRNKPVIVLDAGGTNFRAATVMFDDSGAPVISNFSKQPMPGTKGEIGRDEFFDTIAGFIAPFDSISDTVGFCFSFPTDILPNCDGRLINFNKEVKVRDMAGQLIGEGINKALAARGCGKKHFVIINDTVATMLGGIAAYQDREFDSYIGFILGTGTNTCYIEQCSRIGKLPDINSGTMAINMETGSFDGFVQGDIDKAFDATTANCGDHVYEKMVSGAYQGSVICLTAKKAAEDGLFSPDTAARVMAAEDFTMRQIDQFCMEPDGDNFIASLAANSDDRDMLYGIIDASFERAARMVCVNIGAIMLHTGTGKDKAKPVCVSAEGTTFYKSVLFRPKLDKYVKEFINGKLGLYCEFVKAEDATLIGSAVAGLLN